MKKRRSAFQKAKARCTHLAADVHMPGNNPGKFRCVHEKGHNGPHVDVYFRVMSDRKA